MNKESLFICTFIMSVMVFSSFTPFVYAIKEPTAEVSTPQVAELSTRRELAGSCSGDVWFDELNWTEYQNLRSQMITLVGGWGSELQANLEEAGDLAGVGTNPDVMEAKNVVLPSVVDGSPVMLWDVMNKKAVNPDTYCHLNNLFTRGRISYATELLDNLRYCPTDGSHPCDESLTTKEVENMKDKVGIIDKLTFWESAITPEEEKELETTAPSSVVETSDAFFAINSETNYFFPSTRVDFLNFIRSMNKWDKWIAIVNAASMIAGGAQITNGMRLASSKAGGFAGMAKKFLGVITQRRFITAVSRTMPDVAITVKEVKNIEKTIAELQRLKSAGKIEDYEKLYRDSGITDSLRRLYEAKRNTLVVADGITPGTVSDLLEEGAKITPDSLKADGALLKRLSDDMRMLTPEENKRVIEIAQKLTGDARITTASNAKDEIIDRMMKSAEGDLLDRSEALSALAHEGEILESAGQTAKAVEAGGAVKDAESFTNAIEASKKSIENADIAPGTREFWQNLKGVVGPAEKAQNILKFYLSTWGKGYIGAFLRATQVSQSLFLGALWFRNNIWVQPQLTYPGLVEFELNNKIENFVDKSQEYHYLDVKTSVGKTQVGKFLGGMWDQAMITFGFGGDKENKEQQKVKNIQDIVFIMDQDALVNKLTESTSGSVIIPPSTSAGKEYWRFISMYDSPTKIYNFEHPRGYTPSGLSAMNLHLSNVNIYAVASQAIDNFDGGPWDQFAGATKIVRNAAGAAMFVSLIPAGLSLAIVPGGAVLKTIGALIFMGGATGTINFLAPMVVDNTIGEVGQLMDATGGMDPNVSCKNKFDSGDRKFIGAMKGIRLATSLVSAGANLGKGTPVMLVGFVSDIIQLGAGYFESNRIDKITKNLERCVDSEYEVLAFKNIMSQDEIKTTSKDLLSPLEAEGLKIFDLFSPELASQFDALAEDMKQQAMHIQVDAEDTPLTSISGDEVYRVHFRDADIRWFQGPSCNIDVCQKYGDGFKCITQNGYLILDEEGNTLVEGPSALGYRVNMPELYASIVQRVIEVKKTGGEFLEIYPDKVEVKGDCLKRSIANLTGIRFTTSDIDNKLSRTIGTLEAVHTSDALIMFDSKKQVNVQFLAETECSGGETYGIGEVLRVPDGHLKMNRDNDGTLQVIGNDSQVKCEFRASGEENALVFSNALVRSGFAQQPSSGNRIDYSDVFHLFIYGLTSSVSAKDDIDDYVIKEECTLDDGTKGFKMSIKSSLPDVQEQWNTLLDGICVTDMKGEGESGVTYNDSEVTATDPNGLSKKYTTIGFDPACHDEFSDYTGPAYKVYDEVSQKNACLFIEKGPNGQPQIIIDAQAPIPLLSWGGMGGYMMYDSGKGTISIKNEFPFSLDPKFAWYGAGGLGMMTPTLEPWGGKVAGKTGDGGDGGNPLAALPWTPDGIELILFVIALAGGLLFVRIRYRKAKGA